ncbi:MAG: twin-arginine translocase subunit TatC, partial [Pirellulales bacterium]|nr:twin-arginine translocase subunit TatC [Pirellulales bacterium]
PKTAGDGTELKEAKDREENLLRLFLWRRSEDDPRLRTKSLNAQEAFTVYLKASLLAGVLLASPWIFIQIWNFVAAGLYPRERRYVHIFLPFSLGLFLSGAALAFVFVFEPVLTFLLMWNRSLGIDPDPRINEWLGFVMILPIGFGIGFQLPLVILFLERIGVFTVQNYLSQWKIAIFVIFVLSAMLTPPDPSSMTLMAIPLTFLYFGGVLLCKLLPRKASPFGESGDG